MCYYDLGRNMGDVMRISKEQKEKNRIAILDTAAKLFTKDGYEKTTTRDICSHCGLSKGTLFNYFDSKESLAMTLVAEALERSHEIYRQNLKNVDTLYEELFLLIASELRALKPYRSFLGPVLASSLSIFSKNTNNILGRQIKAKHEGMVGAALHRHGYAAINEAYTIIIYWSLYLGVLAYWSNDASENQSETLALLDYSVKVFVNTISGNIALPEIASNG
jgi:AcrR family transcriptional regulator